jgi:hypothetical protein
VLFYGEMLRSDDVGKTTSLCNSFCSLAYSIVSGGPQHHISETAWGLQHLFFPPHTCIALFSSPALVVAGFHNRWLPQRQQEQLHNRSPENPSCLSTLVSYCSFQQAQH